MPVLDVPGVYIDEVTSPGVIAGVGTSTAAFIGPALNGPIDVPTRISSFDDFLKTFGQQLPDGSFNAYIQSPPVYLAHGVRSFYDNGGVQAYVVRVGTALAATWDILNAAGEVAFRLRATQQGTGGNAITVQVQAANATGAAGVALANPTATFASASANGLVVTVTKASDAATFRVGDIITREASPEPPANRATITNIQGANITINSAIAGWAAGDTVRIASIVPAQITARLASTTGIFAGSIVTVSGVDDTKAAISEPALVQSVDAAGFVTFALTPARAKTYSMSTGAGFTTPVLISQEFRIIVTPTSGSPATFDNLSLLPQHPGFVFSAITSPDVTVVAPLTPPLAAIPQSLIPTVAGNLALAVTGVNDNPGSVGLGDYQNALDSLKDIQDVNILVVPDAAASPSSIPIQQAIIQHCAAKKDRFAVLDSRLGESISGAGSIADHRLFVEAPNGYAAIYYPWLTIKDPSSSGPIPVTMLVPPSGAIAGVYARTDNERGVHKAPANTDVRGVLGLERIVSDPQQGPLNLAGVDVLRIFPGTAQVIVWGARTTDSKDTDWLYVNVRRLMIYIERSLEEGLRWAVFEPNGLPLWQKVKRTINEFLTRVWQSGALFGATADKAFYVRIDEGNNPPATRALGQLHIEIGVAPVRPAEFIVVHIGLWDGGAQISES